MFTSRHSIVKFEMEQHQTLHTTSSHARVTFRLCSFAKFGARFDNLKNA